MEIILNSNENKINNNCLRYKFKQLIRFNNQHISLKNMIFYNFFPNMNNNFKSLVVNYSECSQCGHSKAYLGKTKNSLYERFYASGTGHLVPNCANNALLNHLCESENPKCSFNFEDVKILETAWHDLLLRYMESILLKYEKQTLNTQERSIRLNLI